MEKHVKNKTNSPKKAKKRKILDNKTENIKKIKMPEKNNIVSKPAVENQKKSLINLPKPEDYDKNWKQLCQAIGISPNPKPKIIKSTQKHSSVPKEGANSKNDVDIWFDDVDEALLPIKSESSTKKRNNAEAKLVKTNTTQGLTKAVALDCEMVGIGDDGVDNLLARVSIVNQFGHCILDKYVKNTETVTDYRTAVSGITKELLIDGEDFKVVQKEVSDIIKDRILVGHALKNDLQVLFLDHPKKKIRDTQRYKPFRAEFNGRLPSLKKLTAKILNVDIQGKAHSSIEDAQAAMRLYTMYKKQWESSLGKKKDKEK